MQDVRGKYVPPSIGETAFNCPHCGALAHQFWFSISANPLKMGHTPHVATTEDLPTIPLPAKEQERARAFWERLVTGQAFLDSTDTTIRGRVVHNLSISHCFQCKQIGIWISNRLVWPHRGEAPLPNPDLPEDVQADYNEASTVLDLSPRGAAALLRLAIQKLCAHLGETGKDLNSDIAALVKKGLDVQIQQALDVVRVIGNKAVHPGQIELRDDRATAEKLFALVNLIAERMITVPKHVKEMYDDILPESTRQAIERRDAPEKK